MIFIDNPILLLVIIFLMAISVVAIIFSLISYGKYDALKKRLDIFMSGKDGDTLEDFFKSMQSNIDMLMENDMNERENLRKLNRITRRSFQKLGFYKYDALEERTGRRSFTLALLDFTNTGFVVTCQSIGDTTSIYIKDVDAGATNVKLGDEEQKALEIAMGQRDKYAD